MATTEDVTIDHFYGGKVVIHQPRNGYRSSMDACLLTEFVSRAKPIRNCLEFGFGTGLLGIGLVSAGCVENLIGVEIQSELANLGKRSIVGNGCENQIRIIEGDLRKIAIADIGLDPDAVVMNPPYWAPNQNKMPRNIQKQIGGFEMYGALEDWVGQGARFLRYKRNRMFIVYPAMKMMFCFGMLAKFGWMPNRLRFVHPMENSNAELILVEARKGDFSSTIVEKPLHLKAAEGMDSEDANRIVEGRFTKSLIEKPDQRVPR